jgi:hypothetical protein
MYSLLSSLFICNDYNLLNLKIRCKKNGIACSVKENARELDSPAFIIIRYCNAIG